MVFLIVTFPLTLSGDHTTVLHEGAEIIGCGTSARDYNGSLYYYRELYVLDDPTAAVVRRTITIGWNGDAVTAGGWACPGAGTAPAFYLSDAGELPP